MHRGIISGKAMYQYWPRTRPEDAAASECGYGDASSTLLERCEVWPDHPLGAIDGLRSRGRAMLRGTEDWQFGKALTGTGARPQDLLQMRPPGRRIFLIY
jgi:hypothetical protein